MGQGKREQRAMTVVDAARSLNLGPRIFGRLVESGGVLTVRNRGQKLVPRCEVLRLARILGRPVRPR